MSLVCVFVDDARYCLVVLARIVVFDQNVVGVVSNCTYLFISVVVLTGSLSPAGRGDSWTTRAARQKALSDRTALMESQCKRLNCEVAQ